VIYGQWWSLVIDQIRHLLRANRKEQARKNIAAHYDLGNDFYTLWLDPTMTYSSALWEGTGSWGKPVDLQQGQQQKIDRAIASLQLSSTAANQRVLEIGCGWAGFAHRLLETHPIQYVGLTLSTEQKRWGDERLSASSPSRFEIRLQDYRDEQQQYDGIVSIEMFEAVGEQYWNDYFQTLHRCLKPGARAVIQTITIDESLFERYRQSTDFIQQYIFPGGMLPSKTTFREGAVAAGLQVQESFCFGQDYSRTLAEWAKTFDARSHEIEALGFKESFQRMWRFYLSYCEAGFAEGNLDVVQFTLSRPES
jgi:cyclopropane-fatty-acyl-phospholipid synthase